MLTWLADHRTWLMIRRVQRVDGEPVADAGRTFESILAGGRVSLSSLANQNAKYNLGPIRRNFNEPTWPLRVFDPQVRPRFRFRVSRDDGRAAIVGFTEHDRPTLIRGTDGRDVPVEGCVSLQRDGTIGQASLHARFARITSETTVVFRRDARLGIVVPAAMDERLSRDDLVVTGHATYDHFKRFETSVRVVPPASR
jgi:hypothetical protein